MSASIVAATARSDMRNFVFLAGAMLDGRRNNCHALEIEA
jgi:hypothetical protein